MGIIGGRGRSEISKFDTTFKNNPRLKFFYPILIKKVVAFTTRSVLCDFLKISVITSIYKPTGLYSGGLIHGGAYTRVVLVCGDLGGLIRGAGAYTRGGLLAEFYGISTMGCRLSMIHKYLISNLDMHIRIAHFNIDHPLLLIWS